MPRWVAVSRHLRFPSTCRWAGRCGHVWSERNSACAAAIVLSPSRLLVARDLRKLAHRPRTPRAVLPEVPVGLEHQLVSTAPTPRAILHEGDRPSGLANCSCERQRRRPWGRHRPAASASLRGLTRPHRRCLPPGRSPSDRPSRLARIGCLDAAPESRGAVRPRGVRSATVAPDQNPVPR